jgi:hypothetical protein
MDFQLRERLCRDTCAKVSYRGAAVSANTGEEPIVNITDAFEAGLVRPPSEAGSYLLRLTRNCPWNRCTFSPPVRFLVEDAELF